MSVTYEPRRLKRVWMPIATVSLGVSGFTALVLADALEPLTQGWIGLGFILGTPLLLVIWLLFLSGLRWYMRFAYLLLASLATAGVIYGLWLSLRWDGSIGGSGIPRPRWIWTKTNEASLADLRVQSGKQVELSAFKDANYPQFLGRERDGVVHGVRLERDWSKHPPKELWRKNIGLGWSAFAVAGDYIFTQEQREGKELVVCYELKTGNAIWKHEHEVRFNDKQGGDGPRSTPTIHDGRVYTVGATGILDCIDGATGKNIWSVDILGKYNLKNLIWGKSDSPLVFEDKVIVTGGLEKNDSKEKKDSLLAFDRETGKPLWQAGDDAASYCSPTLATLDGKKQILIVNAQSVTGHDPDDGKIL